MSATATASTQAAALHSCSLNIESLMPAMSGLLQVIEQLQSGKVQHIRDKYGPVTGRPKHSQWEHIKNTVTKCKRLHAVLVTDFNDDANAFLTFFRLPASAPKKTKPKKSCTPSRLRAASVGTSTGSDSDAFHAFWQIVEAIPHVAQDIEAEQQEYQDPASGEFSDSLWTAKWGSSNQWEVWHALKLKAYGTYRCSRNTPAKQ